MKEQEQYQNILQRMIHDTENQKIGSSEELIKQLVEELSMNPNLKKYIHTAR
ncbi:MULTISPECIES: hypothetical protein [Oceanobacillus]|uniref:Uncharacterized protein n=1 Tax=Oceanobacillus kimchii TaxID=746691 RepID=A0ABQ5TNJ7_9BACI|nr:MULTISPECIES: hypothetical protein [Oceanobacillus]MBT2600142.1 hypothetical protein [Oceanobacillus sp. ISL-74]MBT2650300.1 hypothetical protein [Oceanobacillus sp. ISL-73]MCT1578043.1 hypothetical protein [Oceanobacillus kimchii]MCT2137603.1 hypothetical protein [Oceanobacillus kimchii]GLO67183.1 hypothetical protein MACH08_29670 [Oceanobacillus kimchii]